MKMKNIFLLFIVLLLNKSLFAQYNYPDYLQSYYIQVLFPQKIDGGGGLSVGINNNVLRFSVNAGFQASPLKTGKIMHLLTTPQIGDMELGALNDSYSVYVKDGWICITGDGSSIISLDKTLEKNISSIPPLGSDGSDPIEDFRKSWDYKNLLPTSFSGGGGGGVTIEVASNLLTVNFSGGFSSSPLRTGIIDVIPTSSPLPDMNLGVITGSYSAYIQGGALYISSSANESLTGVGKKFTVDLSSSENQTDVKLSRDRNYVYTTFPQEEVVSISDKIVSNNVRTINYFDGLGRVYQELQVAASSNQKDLIRPVTYDKKGRRSKEYLPFEASIGDIGAYKNNAVDAFYTSNCQHRQFYTNSNNSIVFDNNAYSENIYDNSPLNRITVSLNPGEDWRSHPVRMEYHTNKSYEVLSFKLEEDIIKNKEGDLSNGMYYYKANQLYKNIMKNENWISSNDKLHTTEEFKNKFGQVILKRTYVEDGNDPDSEIDQLDTYYVYDNYGLLRFVLPPEAVRVYGEYEGTAPVAVTGTEVIDRATSLTTLGTGISKYIIQEGASLSLKPGFSFAATSSSSLIITALEEVPNLFDELIYAYKYDSRKRMTHKKLPGALPVYMVYDNRNRVVLTQDGNQRNKSTPEWIFTLYDAVNRPIETGVCSTNSSQGSLQISVGASNNYVPSDRIPFAYTYYDNYTFTGKQNFDTSVKVSQYSDAVENPNYQDAVKGQVTGSRVKVLEDGNDQWIASTNYYDNKYRLIQQVSRQYSESNSTIDIFNQVVSNDYDFVGKIVTSKESQTANGGTVAFTKYYDYDYAGRLKKVDHQMGNGSRETLSEMVYDELGQLVQKKLGNDLQTVDYEYNIRGWLTKLNNPASLGSDLFGMELKYNTGISALSASEQYNGNISAISWAGTKYSGMRTYGYTYDALNRLKQARYGEGNAYTSNLDKYKMSVSSYDLNGNIEFLDRYLNGSLMDKLAYTYIGNQLLTVKDDGLRDQGFVEPSVQEAIEYDYDLNGNLKLDKNKGLTGIEYNHLNLPKKVLAGSDYISYIYDASGAKLAKKVRTNTTEDVHYRGSFVYKGSSLDYVIHDEGLIDYDGGSYTYQYYLKDHLGNTRAIFKNNGGTAQLEQEQHYYPYGMAIDGLKYTGSTANKYMYNGKELQDDLLGGNKLDWLDYGARMYDPSLGRWSVIDAKAEKYDCLTPYNYALNNPIKFIDFDGRDVDDAKVQKEQSYQILKSTKIYQKLYDIFSIGHMKSHTLRLYSANTYHSYAGVKKENGKFIFYVGIGTQNSDTDEAGKRVDDYIHELFVHQIGKMIALYNSDGNVSVDDLNSISNYEYAGRKSKNGEKDHVELVLGKKLTYNKLLKELKGVMNPLLFKQLLGEVEGLMNQYSKDKDYVMNVYYSKVQFGVDISKTPKMKRNESSSERGYREMWNMLKAWGNENNED